MHFVTLTKSCPICEFPAFAKPAPLNALPAESLSESAYKLTDELLSIQDVPAQFELSCVTEIVPEKNTSLEGLYRSRGM